MDENEKLCSMVWKVAPLIGLRDEDMNINTMITTYNTAVTDASSEYLGRNVEGKSRGSPKVFSTSVMRGEILRRSGMKQKEQKNLRPILCEEVKIAVASLKKGNLRS